MIIWYSIYTVLTTTGEYNQWNIGTFLKPELGDVRYIVQNETFYTRLIKVGIPAAPLAISVP